MALFDLMRKYPDAPYNWDHIVHYNPPVDIIRLFESKWNWQYLYNSEVTVELIREYRDKPWNFDILSIYQSLESIIANIDLPFTHNKHRNKKFILVNLHLTWDWDRIIYECKFDDLQLFINIINCEITRGYADEDGEIMELIVANPHLNWNFNKMGNVTIDFILANDKPWNWPLFCVHLKPADVQKLPEVHGREFSRNKFITESDIIENSYFNGSMDRWTSMGYIISRPGKKYTWDFGYLTTEFIIYNNKLPYGFYWNGYPYDIYNHRKYMLDPKIPKPLRDALMANLGNCAPMEFLIDNYELAKLIDWPACADYDFHEFATEFVLANVHLIDLSQL